MITRHFAAFLGVVFALSPGALTGQDTRPGIAVLPFEVAQLPPMDLSESGLNYVLQQMLLTDLNANDAIRIVERRELNRILDELELGESGRMDDATAAEVGKLVGARYMIGTSYFDDSRRIRLDGRVIDVETSVIVSTARVTDDREELIQLVSELASEITNDADLPPLPEPAREAQRQEEAPGEAIRLFASALYQEENGELDEALDTLTQLVQDYPDYQEAAQYRDKLQSG